MPDLSFPKATRTAPAFPRLARFCAAILLSLALSACNSTTPEVALNPVPSSSGARPEVKTLDPPGKGRFGDHKPVDFGRHHPDRYPVHGIDVSKWQGTIDWQQVRQAG